MGISNNPNSAVSWSKYYLYRCLVVYGRRNTKRAKEKDFSGFANDKILVEKADKDEIYSSLLLLWI